MRTDEFDFDLPPQAIAQHPVSPRDSARLLVVSETLTDRSVADLPRLLAAGDLLVYNDTQVLPARLFGLRGAAAVTLTLIHPLGADRWRALARPARRLAVGQEIVFAPDFTARVDAKGPGGELDLTFCCHAAGGTAAAIERHGAMPLPPYIRRPRGGDPRDRHDYQTIFAHRPGAIAAPTAGLHFTERLLAALLEAGIARVAVTLHVGAGTFLPVRADNVEDHVMHAEWGEISATAAAVMNATRAANRRIVAVGTTALRLLESAAAADGTVLPFRGETRLFITPGYRFRVVDRLLTNFHLPRSTLFMLVSAFAGLARMKAAYVHAIAAGYRFYSYGDVCLLDRAAPDAP